jgi:hypothetical protein
MCLSVPQQFSNFSQWQHRGAPPHVPPPPPPIATVMLASDWLGVGIVLRSFCHWPTCHSGKNKNSETEEYLHSKYGRLQISSRDIIRIAFNLLNVVFLGAFCDPPPPGIDSHTLGWFGSLNM